VLSPQSFPSQTTLELQFVRITNVPLLSSVLQLPLDVNQEGQYPCVKVRKESVNILLNTSDRRLEGKYGVGASSWLTPISKESFLLRTFGVLGSLDLSLSMDGSSPESLLLSIVLGGVSTEVLDVAEEFSRDLVFLSMIERRLIKRVHLCI